MLKGLLVGAFHTLQPVWTRCNELVLNVDTIEPEAERIPGIRGEHTDSAKHHDNHVYGSPDYWYIRKIVNTANPGPEDVVYDLGCGMGRILAVLAQHKVKRVVGVEIIERLCEVAERNARHLRGRKAPIDIVRGDCSRVDMSDGTMYFMFNPFGEATLRDTLAHIKQSWDGNRRSITIVYYNPTHEPVLSESGWLKKSGEFQTASGLRVNFWRSVV